MIRTESRIAPLPRLRALSLLQGWTDVARQRAALARLDRTRLADIGLSEAEARAEAARPFWDAPDNWRM